MRSPADWNLKTLTSEQRHRLLGVRGLLVPDVAPRETLRELLRLISGTIQSKVAIAGRRDGVWTLLGESSPEPPVVLPSQASELFDRVGSTLGGDVEAWRHANQSWTLVGLSDRSCHHVLLLLAGDWTSQSIVLRDMAHRLLAVTRPQDSPPPEPSDSIPRAG